MSTDFLEKIEKLPVDKKQEVEDFVDFLLAKANPQIQMSSDTDLKPGFGGGKEYSVKWLMILTNH